MSSKKDWVKYIGKKNNRLEVIGISDRKVSSGDTVLRCKCDCGTETHVIGRSWETGQTKSCGCLSRELSRKRNLRILTGQRFGLLTVLYEMGYKKHGATLWLCVCDCGKSTIVKYANLISGKTKSCGCLKVITGEEKAIDMTGKKYGMLTVIEKGRSIPTNNGTRLLWKCKCDCGNYTEVIGSSLRNGRTVSCGCIKSKGELFILRTLQAQGISFEYQKRFDDLCDKKALSLDFYIRETKTAIEYNGQQHYYPVEIFGGKEAFIKQQKHDEQKREYCKKNGIRLIELPYT